PLRRKEEEKRAERDECEPQVRERIRGRQGIERIDEGPPANEERGRRHRAFEWRRDTRADGNDDTDGPPRDRRTEWDDAERVQRRRHGESQTTMGRVSEGENGFGVLFTSDKPAKLQSPRRRSKR